MEQRCFWGRLCHRAPCSCSHNMLGAIQACAQARLYKSCCQIEQRLSSQLAVPAVICAAAVLMFLPPTRHQLPWGPCTPCPPTQPRRRQPPAPLLPLRLRRGRGRRGAASRCHGTPTCATTRRSRYARRWACTEWWKTSCSRTGEGAGLGGYTSLSLARGSSSTMFDTY